MLEENRLEEFREFVKSLKGVRSEIISSLYKGQEIFGYISQEVKKIIIEETGVSLKKLDEIIKFNRGFSEVEKGKYHLGVCLGERCCKKRAKDVLEKINKELKINDGERTEDGRFSLETLRCVGACGLAPAIIVNKDMHGGEEVENVNNFLERYKDK